MKICRVRRSSQDLWGVISDGDVCELIGSPYDSSGIGSKICSLEEAVFLPPLYQTNKVPAIAANYGEKDERDGPGIFMKQPGTYLAHGGSIVYPRGCKTVIHEAELGIVIGKEARHVEEENALEYVLGYTCVNDVSGREMTQSDEGKGLSMRWKHFDTFCPMGPFIETSVDTPMNLGIECFVNGELSVSGNTSDMIFPIQKLISWVSEVMTLYPGDIIPTGCPGVAEIKVDDVIEVRIEGIGSLVNEVVSDY